MAQELRRGRLRGILLLVTGFAALTAGGNPLAAAAPTGPEPWEAGAFTADPAAILQAASRIDAGAGQGGALILFSEIRVRFEADGRETRVQRTLYRIENAEADASWSAIDASWFPWRQERPGLRARVITPDGAVHTLDPATITEAGRAAEPDMFQDARILRAPLPAAGSGAIVEQEVTTRDTAPLYDRGTTQILPVRMLVPVRLWRLFVEAPMGLPLRHVVRQLPDSGFHEETADGMRRLSFEYRDLTPYEKIETGQPSDVRWFSSVALSTGASWAEVARRYSDIVEAAVREAGRAPEIQTFLSAAAVPAASRRETIDRVLARLGAEVRYTGVELGAGSIVPRSPAETLRHKFGDCKDKAVLLTALLRALDIPAHVALLKSGERSLEIEETLPGMGAFNHAIVVLPGTPEIWIDPTDRYSRAGELPVSDQGRLALIATPVTTGLVRTPEATAADNRVVVTREFVLSDFGSARVVESDESWGEPERDMRVYYATQSEKAVHEMLTEHLQTAFLTDQIGKADHSDPADLAHPFHTRVEAKDAPRGFTDMQSAGVAFFPSAAIRGLPDEVTAAGGEKDGKPAPRQTEYSIPTPFRREIRYHVVPPAGFKAQPPPPGRIRHFGPATLSEEYSVANDGALAATLRFEIDQRRLTAAEFDALRDGVREASKESALLLKFEQVGEAHLAAGRVREGIEELRRLAGLAPQKALPRMRLARALLAGGMGEPAREEARRAVALEPAFAPAYTTLAWTLQHDEVGRRFGKGFDRPGAIAAYRKAKELEPKKDDIRVNLAVLLEYDDKGRHYAVDLAPAIDEYRALQTDLNKHGHDDNLLLALLRAGRFAEMKELLAKIEQSETRSTLRLVAMAATESADAAVAQAERSFPDAAKRQDALLQAAQKLVLSRRYPAAAALLAAAARQAPNAAEILARADLLRKVRPHEEMVLSLDDPADVVKRFLLLFLGSDSPDMAQIEPLVAHELGRELGDEEKTLHSFAGDFGAFRRTLGTKAEVSPDVVADVALTLFHTTVTGDAAVGYRVALSSPFAKEDIAVFLVQEGGKPKLAGSGEVVESLGLEAFLHVQSGDLKGARQWLDWARQEIGSSGGDDPLAVPPFTALWTQGAEATADEARCAAASLLAGSEASGKALPILLACRDAAPEGARRNAFDLALALADLELDKPADMATVARRLVAASPRSPRAYHLLEGALGQLKSWDELHRFAEERLAAAADDPLPALTLYELAVRQGDFGEAEKRLQKAVDQAKPSSIVFNNLAWLALVRGQVDDKAIEAGQRATTLSQYKDPGSLHTLASLYAEQGKTAEAYQLILQVLAERAAETPDAIDWYVFGRLAEHYGLPEAARRYYTRIPAPRPGGTSAISTYSLARKRLAALGPETEAKRRE